MGPCGGAAQDHSEKPLIPPFVVAAHAAFFAAVILGWLWGGRPERFAVAMMVLSRVAFANPTVMWRVDDIYIDSMIEDSLMLLVFGWLALRSDRWWPFVASAASALTVLVHLLTIGTDISWEAAVSARVGLGLLMYVALLVGVVERWLAGEVAVCWSRLAGEPIPLERR